MMAARVPGCSDATKANFILFSMIVYVAGMSCC